MRKSVRVGALCACAGGLGFGLGCSDVDPPQNLGVSRQAVESAQRGVIYDVAFAPARSLGAISQWLAGKSSSVQQQAYVRELASLGLPYWSSGSITIPALTEVGGTVIMAPPPAVSRIRYSCGATLISPSYVITAGHCPTADTLLDELELQMYRPSQALIENWEKTVQLSGAWPSFTHPQLDESDGYLIDRYKCTVKTRCYDADVGCQNPGSDVALLECEGRPGDKYGFLNVSTTSPAGKEALMHWKHEVLDVHTAEPMPADFVEHYVQYPPTPDQNFHYFETGNQLLALRSIPWPDGTPTQFLDAVNVDVHGCHGSSGSGVLAREAGTNEYRLVGPAAVGGRGLSGRLCEQVPNPGGSPTGPGTSALGVNFENPQKLLDQYASLLAADCKARAVSERDVTGLPFTPGSHHVSTLFSFLACQVDTFAHAGSVSALPLLGPYPEKLLDDSVIAEQKIHGFQLEAGADYRAALQVQKLADCAVCSAPELRVGSALGSLSPLVGEASLVSLTLASEGAGEADVRIVNFGTKLAVGGFTLIREGQVNSFDTPEDRLEAALYSLDDAGNVVVGPAPMRFAGDGKAGFEAQLLRGERMAVLRQALGPSHRWTARLGGSSLSSLNCGLLSFEGAPVLTAPCQQVLALDDTQGTAARLGFFIELPADAAEESAAITFVALASDSARDTDADGVPEVLDNCPGDWNAAQGDCSEEPPVVGEGGAGGVPSEGGAGSSEGGASAEAGAPNRENGGEGADPTPAAGSPATGGSSGGGGSPAAGAVAGSAAAGSAGAPSGSSGGNASMPSPKNDSSCSCSVVGGPETESRSLMALVALAIVAGLRRSRRSG